MLTATVCLNELLVENIANFAPAFDDQTSTFIIPSGAGFEVVFCPGARSTTILTTNRDKMLQLAQQGKVEKQATLSLKRLRRDVFRRSAASGTFRLDRAMLAVTVITTALASIAQLW